MTILVNEVAPRTHNSGHYSIEASYTNQFEQHLRSILNLPLGNTDNKVAGIMVNLVGAEGHTGNVVYENIDKILTNRWCYSSYLREKNNQTFSKDGSCNHRK